MRETPRPFAKKWHLSGAALALASLTACADPGADLTSDKTLATIQAADTTAAEVEPEGEDEPVTEPGSSPPSPDCGATSGRPGGLTTDLRDSDDKRKAIIHGVSFFGDLCGTPEQRCVRIHDGGVSIIFARQLEGSRWNESVTASCAVKVELEVLDGYQIGSPKTAWYGFGARANATRTYAFDGEPAAAPITSKLPKTDFSLVARPDLSSPTCSGSRHTTFVSTLDVSFNQQDEAFQVDAFELVTHFVAGVEWRRCNQEPEPEPPSQLGKPCGGPHNLVCAASLVCEGVDDDFKRCVDPDEAVPPAPQGQPCGGPRKLLCADGLSCLYPAGVPEDGEVLGSCQGDRIARSEECEPGSSSRTCEDGTYCVRRRGKGLSQCLPATGELKSFCGEELPPCHSPLVCNDGSQQCETPPEGCSAGTCADTIANNVTVRNYCWPAGNYCVSDLRGKCGGELPECPTGGVCNLETGFCSNPCGDQWPECLFGYYCDVEAGRCVLEERSDDEDSTWSESSI